MDDNLIIQAIAVRKTYHTGTVAVPALRGVDLRMQRGAMVAVLRPSGCGETRPLTCLPALACAALVASYPEALEGRRARRRALRPRVHPGLLALVGASVLFESQVKLSLHLLQPLLESGLGQLDLAVVGGLGGLVFGGYQLLAGVLA